MEFEWDDRKSQRNIRIHGVSFSLAQHALESGLVVELREEEHGGEWRVIAVAPISEFLLTIVFTVRDNANETSSYVVSQAKVVRIISARKASVRERAFYYQSRPPTDR